MATPWEPKPADRIVRRPREAELDPVRVKLAGPQRSESRALSSPLVLVYAFAALVIVGTLLLLLPFTHYSKRVVREGESVTDPSRQITLTDAKAIDPDVRIGQRVGGGFTPFVDALFTATSAATVTGLITQDTPTYWTRTGHAFILAIMFVGGLGFLTVVTLTLILAGQRGSIRQRVLVRDSYQVDQLGGLTRLTIQVVIVVVVMQIVGAVALGARFLYEYTPVEAVWQAVFHSVSAFNGAGFAALPSGVSLSAFQTDKAVLGTMGVLILLGAIGYWPLSDVVRSRKFSRLSLNTKLVLVLTLVLTVAGALAFFGSEYDNENTLGPLSVADKAAVSLFESVSGRTAGFSTVDYGEALRRTYFTTILLMFIGGASASVAGGIKVNTLGVILVATISTLRGEGRASAFFRTVPQVQVQRAITIVVLGVGLVFVTSLMLAFTESGLGIPFTNILFDNVSGAGTVGLSTGATDSMSGWGQLVLVGSMFIGKMGPPTLSLYMVRQREHGLYQFARERVTLG